MNRNDVLTFIQNNLVCSVATAANNRPAVRIMRIIRADTEGIVFNTKRFKDSYQELTVNPRVELCFYNADEDIQIRVYGAVETKEELALKQKIVEEFPKLSGIVEKHGYDAIVPFCLNEWDFKHCTRH